MKLKKEIDPYFFYGKRIEAINLFLLLFPSLIRVELGVGTAI
jgi:hypothetical protein